jgi:hypothetical protein
MRGIVVGAEKCFNAKNAKTAKSAKKNGDEDWF